MKKVMRRISNVLVAITVAVSLFSNVQVSALAEESGAGEYYNYSQFLPEGFAEMYEKFVIPGKDTITIDFSEDKTAIYERGEVITTELLDNITEMNYTEEEKKIIFIMSLVNYNKFFKMDQLEMSMEYAKGRIVIDDEAGQYIHFDMVDMGGKTYFDASGSTGTYTTTISYQDVLASMMQSGEELDTTDAHMPFFGAIAFYGVDLLSTGGKFNLNIVFSNNEDEPAAEEPVVEEPVVDEPVVDEPVVDAPATGDDKPSNEEPVVEEPTTGTEDEPSKEDEPVVEEPTTGTENEPSNEEPVVEEPTTGEENEPAKEEPVVDEPTTGEEDKPSKEDEPVVDEPKTEEEENPVEIIDTLVIDFSKNKVQTYKEALTEENIDSIGMAIQESDTLEDQEKNVVFLYAMNLVYGLFEVEDDCIVIDRDKNQIIKYTVDENGTKLDANKAAGENEIEITPELLTKKNSMLGHQMAFVAAEALYGVNSKESFKIKFIFGEAEEPSEDPTQESPSEEEKPTEKPSEEEKPSEVKPEPTNNDDKADDQKKEEQKTTPTKTKTVETLAIGSKFVENSYSYKVTAEGEVAFAGITDKALKTINIPDTVDHQNVTYKVTSVADKALYNNKKIINVTVGSNVTAIGKSAFAKCKKLKSATIKTTSLSKIGKKAFNKNSKDLVVKVKKSSYKGYKKLFKKAKMSKIKLKKVK